MSYKADRFSKLYNELDRTTQLLGTALHFLHFKNMSAEEGRGRWQQSKDRVENEINQRLQTEPIAWLLECCMLMGSLRPGTYDSWHWALPLSKQ